MSGSIVAPNNPPLSPAQVAGIVPSGAGSAGITPLASPPGGGGGTPGVDTGGVSGFKPTDASSLIGAQNILMGRVGTSIQDMNAARNYGVTGSSAIAGGAGQVAGGQVAGITADAAVAASLQSDYTETYSRWGTTPGHPSDLVASFSSAIQKEALDIHSSRAAIDQKLSVSFLDNPVEWLMNQVTVPFDLDALRNKKQGMEDDLEVLTKLRDATKEETVQAQATAYTLGAGKAAALSQQYLGQAQITAGQAQNQVAGILTGVAGIGDKIAGTDFTAAAQVLHGEIEVDETSYKKVINLQAAARNNEEGKMRVDMLGLQDKDATKATAAQNSLDARVQAINNVAGTKFSGWKEFAALPDSKEKSLLMSLATDPNIQQGNALSVVGPGEAIALANGLKLPLTPGEDLLRKQLTVMGSAYVRDQRQLIKTMTPEQIAIGTNDYMKRQVQTELKNIPSTGGIYSPPSLATSLQLPGIAGTKLSLALLPLAANPDGTPSSYGTDSKDVIAAANQLIATGKATPEEMGASVASFYGSQALAADAAHGYRKFTLPSPLSLGTWNSSIVNESNSILSPYVTHNLMNQAEMTMYFTRSAIRDKATPSISPTAPGMVQ